MGQQTRINDFYVQISKFDERWNINIQQAVSV